MRLEINVNKDEHDERIVIYATEITEELQKLINEIETSIQDTKLYGRKDDEIYPLHMERMIRFYTENKQVFAEDEQNYYRIDKRLYQLENMLPNQFIRISQSEIINIHYIKKLKQELSGFIKISLINGVSIYSSRRYVKIIKEALGL